MPEAKQRHLSSVRRLAAIMFTDIVGYTTMMSKDEQETLSTLRINRDTHKKLILDYGGQFLKEMGDGILAKRLDELSFDFIVKQQNLIVDSKKTTGNILYK